MTESKKSPARPTLKAVRGTRDLLPDQTPLWNHVESTARAVFARYGFGEIRTPIFETTELFARGVGEETDIVSKEMFTWEDRARAASEKAQQLTLRPENTAGVVRAYIEHKLGETGQLQKLYYIGPQFRRERPQRGRYRQFWQIGAEVIGPQSSGSESPLRDAEILEMLASLLDELGIRDWRLELNSVGSSDDRVRYNAALREALAPIKHQLCEDNQRRAETNPLRVLDSQRPSRPGPHQRAAQDRRLPRRSLARPLRRRPRRARRLRRSLHRQSAPGPRPRLLHPHHLRVHRPDGTGLGTQNALLGGGRYDGLSEMLGGPKAPGIGFAIGEDRLILTLQAQAEGLATPAIHFFHAYIAPLGEALNPEALRLARELRRAGLRIEVGDGAARLKKSFEMASKALARKVVILGEDELRSGQLTVKDMWLGQAGSGVQEKIDRKELSSYLHAQFDNESPKGK